MNRSFEKFKSEALLRLDALEKVHTSVSGEARTAAFEQVCDIHGIIPPLYFDESE